MDRFSRLHAAVIAQHLHGDLPDFLFRPIVAIARRPEDYVGCEAIVDRLLEQLLAFDPYAHTGCFNEGYDTADLSRTLAQLTE